MVPHIRRQSPSVGVFTKTIWREEGKFKPLTDNTRHLHDKKFQILHPSRNIIPFEGKNNMCFKGLPYSPLGVGLPHRHGFSICFAAMNNFMADATVSCVHEFRGAVLGLEAVG